MTCSDHANGIIGPERLERRRLFAAGATLQEGGVLVLMGDLGVANELSVGLERGIITATVGDETLTVAEDRVHKIRIIGGERGDVVHVEPSVSIPVYIQTGDGDDSVSGGGAGNDRIALGNGDDVAEAGAGNDTVLAGNGRDTITLGDGDDKARGGNGSDKIWGGRGNDTVFAQSGDDRVWGQEGSDRLETGVGFDRARGGDDRDTLVGMASADLMGNAGPDKITRVDELTASQP